MSYIADSKVLGNGWVAVGWLNPDHPFSKGDVPADFVARLKEFARDWFKSVGALEWGVAAGFHTCEFCNNANGSGTFGVPAGEYIYFVPEMIAHYVECHEYCPPPEFMAAVMACPLPGTDAYKEAARKFALAL